MKKILLIIIGLLTFFPCVVFANEYNTLKISAVFSTSVDVSGIEKIAVHYNTIKNGTYKEEIAYLLRSNNYSMVISTNPIEDIQYLYTVCIGDDDTYDNYGFLFVNSNKKNDLNDNTLELELVVSFNDMGFDGKNYRHNSEVSDEYIEERNEGIPIKESKITTVATTTTTQAAFTTVTTIRPTTTIIHDDEKTNYDGNTETSEMSKSILKYVIIVGASLLVIVGVVILVKMRQARNKV